MMAMSVGTFSGRPLTAANGRRAMAGFMSLSYAHGGMGSVVGSATAWFSQSQEHMHDVRREMRLLLNSWFSCSLWGAAGPINKF
ncbi:MAG: hypothetical protein QOG58_3878 [Caballeronia sp.]|nr:hypothetical protein [Caballeronia sp.]